MRVNQQNERISIELANRGSQSQDSLGRARRFGLNLSMAFALLLGCSAAAWQPFLPTQIEQLVLAGLTLALVLVKLIYRRSPAVRVFLPVLFLLGGYLYTSVVAERFLATRLPVAQENIEQLRTGCIVDFPKYANLDDPRAPARVLLQLQSTNDDRLGALDPMRTSVSWYQPPKLKGGECWQVKLKLRRVHAEVNPGGFDFERFAALRRIQAVGYVVQSPANQRLSEARGLLALREHISQIFAEVAAIDPALSASEKAQLQRALGLAQALAVADTRMLSDADWTLFRSTGITHLIAISGLHITLLAGFGALFGRLLTRAFPQICRVLPRPQLCAILALLFASGYGALAGFAVPAQRTLLMLGALLLGVMFRRSQSLWQGYALALIAVLLLDPFAVLAAGFWLSFAAVGILLLVYGQRWPERGFFKNLVPAQLLMSLGLLPFGLLLFQQISLSAPIINLLAVPFISLLVVPLVLLGLMLSLLSTAFAAPVIALALILLRYFGVALEVMHTEIFALLGPIVNLSAPGPIAFGLACAGLLWLFAPKALPGRAFGLLLLLPLFLPQQAPDHDHHAIADQQFRMTLFDVGQGLSALIQTRTHAVLYDTGPGWPEGANAGESQVLPSLLALGVQRLDKIVLSHADLDHAGGLNAITDAYPNAVLWTSAVGKNSNLRSRSTANACQTGRSWRWDGVEFKFLHPNIGLPYLRNQSSCVLHVSTGRSADASINSGFQSALLPGDIDVLIEARMLRIDPTSLQADVLIAAHHGSAGSNSAAFLRTVNPAQVWYPVGHQNRFDFPRQVTRDRVKAQGASEWNVSQTGALSLIFGEASAVVTAERTQQFWWRGAVPLTIYPNQSGSGADDLE